VSYLNPLRLHFAGQFGAAISTVNNDPRHFDNATFLPEYQDPSVPGHPNGWFNPRGSGDWRLFGCRITSAWLASGQASPVTDSVHGAVLADSDRRVAAKLVDLDPDQQLVSMIWGLEIRLCVSTGLTLLRGQFQPAAFMHIWDRAQSGAGDLLAGAEYQSVLTDLEWSDISTSPTLQELHRSAEAGELSIKFNVDGVSLSSASPDFLLGRVVGTIGPCGAGEPRHFVAGRQFMPNGLPSGNFFAPDGLINSSVASVDETTRRLYLDLGNGLPTLQAGGPPAPLGTVAVVVEMPSTDGQPDGLLSIGEIPESVYTAADWYSSSAGIVALPGGRELTDDELTAIADHPLTIRRITNDGTSATAVSEYPSGVHVRADQFVFRLDAGEAVQARLFASRFGKPYAGARVIALLDPSALQSPAPGVPTDAISFPARLETDAHGIAVLPVEARNPGNPRDFIDGQVYGIRVAIEDTLLPGSGYPFNPWEFVSLLVWGTPSITEPPTWTGGLQPIFQQYANLYPVMQRFLDLSDYAAVCDRRRLLILALSLPLSDPNSMPVTRDLSGAKRKAILRWLADLGPDGQPLKGGQPPAPVSQTAVQPAVPGPDSSRGGKAAASNRRFGLRPRDGRR
jgi:hypothetical protein